MEQVFKAEDGVLEQLVAERRDEVLRLQKSEADQIQDLETRGQERGKALRASLPKEILGVIEKQDKAHDAEQKRAVAGAERTRTMLMDSACAPQYETAMHPGLAGGHLVAPHSLGWFTPYHGTLHWSDGTVVWQGYYPGSIDLAVAAAGSGWGVFGSGAASYTLIMDWWFTYSAPENRNYGHTIYVPYHGFYIVQADDGFWDSKEARARIDLSAVGYQYNYKATSTTNVFDLQSQNINVNDRFDGWRTMYYSDLLGADRAYLRVSSSFQVYARGGGSTAQLNFSDGGANYMGVPWVHID
jgi:hypothetical protein